MGKDNELLDAARNGNIIALEKILYQKSKRSGPLASLRRGAGANVQDNTGYSALHHASLNGHIECVRLLLAHEASPNLPDYRGSSPLHLAAWAGHQDIVKLLLTHSHRPANPNLQTVDNETPLHCAAQHGHTGALTTLLAHGANPNMANNRGEKPLDLAAQYGRIQAVQMLIRAHPDLLVPYKYSDDDDNRSTDDKYSDIDTGKILNHSPLHLASRNGHKTVVEVLLTAGVNVNLLTTSGTALHEAALCGKDSVVRTLLDYGSDLSVTDSDGRTALDLLEQFPPHVTKGIISVINNHQNAIAYKGKETDEVLRITRRKTSKSMPPSMDRGYDEYDSQKYNERQEKSLAHLSDRWNSYSIERGGATTSPSSSMGSLGPPSPRQMKSSVGRDSSSGSGGLSSSYVPMAPFNSNSKISPTPPKKPPRRNLSISPTASKNSGASHSSSTKNAYEYLFLARTGSDSNDNKTIGKAVSFDQYQNYVKMMNPNANSINLSGNELPPTQLRSYNPNRKLRRIRDNYEGFGINGSHGTSKDTEDNVPTSPSQYKQPPTPEHPPPSAKQAEKFILERIRPLSQEYKRRSMGFSFGSCSSSGTIDYRNRNRRSLIYDIQHTQHNVQARNTSLSPSSPDLLIYQSLNVSSGSLSSSVSLSDRSASTDCVEEYIGDVPFAGLFKGSTMTLNNPNSAPFGAKNPQSDYHGFDHSYPGNHADNVIQQQRPERPKTLRTTNTPIQSLKPTEIEHHSSFHPPDNQYSNSKPQAFHSSSEDDSVIRPKMVTATHISSKITNKESNTAGENNADSVIVTDKTNAFGNILSPFDEQEEWAKISEIMASFGTDLGKDFIVGSSSLSNKKRRSYQNRNDGARSNSIAGFSLSVANNDSSKARGKAVRGSLVGVKSLDSPLDYYNRSLSPHSELTNWLYENELEHLDKLLFDNGYDDIEFINGVLDESDLELLNVNESDRKLLLAAVQNDLPKPPRAISKAIKNLKNISPYSSASSTLASPARASPKNSLNNNLEKSDNTNDKLELNDGTNKENGDDPSVSVDEWLKSIKLLEYSEVFKKHLYTDMERISRVWEIELQTVLEINKLGHRKRILHSVGATPATPITSFNKSLAVQDKSKLPVISKGKKPEIVPGHRHNHRKTRHAPKPPSRSSIDDSASNEELINSTSNLEIRGPAELLLGVPVGLRTQWRHTAEALVTGSVQYEVNYLGSTVVKELRGTESTRKSIQKLKKGERASLNEGTAGFNNSHHNVKRPLYISISYCGVKFIDINTQGTICEHEIRNINCACQDADDLSHFAYITKDSDYDIHYCHVFNVASMDLATEIILTLGQAFEVAYQLALRKSTPTTPLRSPNTSSAVSIGSIESTVGPNIQQQQKQH